MAKLGARQWTSLCGIAALWAVGMVRGWGEEPLDGPAVTRVAFGSCCHQNKSQAIWDVIAAREPEIFLFLGDNIYGDTEDMEVMRAKYGMLRSVPAYQKLRESCRVLATWDDHDYGLNDAGADYRMRAESQREFLEAFEVPKERRNWEGPGIYDAYWFGEKGRRLQVILLDTRYFRSPLKRLAEQPNRALGPYDENWDEGVTMLGEEQWAWLEAQLAMPADLRILASSIQVLPVDHHWERWQNLPRERERLLGLLRGAASGRTLILSGDRHAGEIMRMGAEDALGVGYPLYEVTSSGLNQGGGGGRDEPNRYRTGERYGPANFGWLEIEWKPGGPEVRMELCNTAGEVVLEEVMRE